MILSATTDKLSLITDQAGDIDVVVTYIDRNQSTGAIGEANRQLTNITTATTTDILAAPAATTDRKVESITIRNAHASTSNDVTVQYNANGTLYELHAARLYATEMLQWSEHNGFEHVRRRDLPVFARRMSEVVSRTNDIVSGTDINVFRVYNTEVLIQPTKVGGQTRVFAGFSHWNDLAAAATTTGAAIGLFAPALGFSSSGNPRIEACVASVTAATLSVNGGGTGVDSLVANGTSALANLPGWLGGWVKWTEAAGGEQEHSFSLGCNSEVDASRIDISRGTIFEVFESTEI